MDGTLEMVEYVRPRMILVYIYSRFVEDIKQVSFEACWKSCLVAQKRGDDHAAVIILIGIIYPMAHTKANIFRSHLFKVYCAHARDITQAYKQSGNSLKRDFVGYTSYGQEPLDG